MKTYAAFLVLFAIFLVCDPIKASPARVRRQGWSWGGDSDNNAVRPTRQTRPTRPPTPPTVTNPATPTVVQPLVDGTTTASPQYLSCIAACQVTQQYNPVCGNNRITYDNIGKLNCARRCGLTVESLFNGTCSPLR